ncbi:hypothetical protein RFI_37271, partial [Reticulomyxa filosa]
MIKTNLKSGSYSENKNDNKNNNDNKLLQNKNKSCYCQKCYGPNSRVSCNKCQKESSKGYVWHCPEGKNRTHSKGFDLCADCGALQLQWDELNGLSLVERDERFPIR